MPIIKRRPELNTIKDVVLANVGQTEEEFLSPKPEYRIDGLKEAAEIIRKAVASKQTITVIADYDADGVGSAAILKLMFTALGITPVIRIPRRFSEGYGLSEKIVDEINDGLVITVDNGIAAAAAIKKAKDKGLTVIVTDHHLPPADGILPEADVLIDPAAIPGSADFTNYCGAGIAYKLAIEVLGKDHKFIPKLLSFAAISTVADAVKLVGENRFIVKDGLASMTTYAGRTTGLGALLERCEMDKFISEKNIAFKIAPMINAPGRLSDTGAETSLDAISFNSRLDVAKAKAEELYGLNETRKALKEEGLQVVRKNIINNCLFGEIPLVIYEPGLREGLVGIYAGKIAEEYQTPCFVLTDSDDPDIIKGSGRSFGGVHLKNILDANADLLYKYGGHAEAAGLSLRRENLDKLREGLAAAITEPINTDTGTSYYDIEIPATQIEKTLNELKPFAPFGEGNPEIVFYIKEYMLSPGMTGYYRTMGDSVLIERPDGTIVNTLGSPVANDKKLLSEFQAGLLNLGRHVKLLGTASTAVGFDMAEKYKLMGEPKIVNLVGTLSWNYFRGEATPQIEIIEIEDANKSIELSPMAALLSKMAKERYA